MKFFKKIVLILFILFPIFTSAKIKKPDYEITDIFINSTIDILGSIHVQEAIIVKGSIQEFERNITYKNPDLPEWEPGKVDFTNSSFYSGRGVAFSKAHAFSITEDEIGFEVLPGVFDASFTETESAKKGDTGVYTVEEYEGGKKVTIYSPNESGYMVYVFDYYVNQTVVLHNDIAEMNWTFIPKDFDDIGHVSIQLTTPGSSLDKYFKFWAHGSLKGTISPISTSLDADGNVLYGGVYVDVKNVKSGSGVDIRMTFDKTHMQVVERVLNHSTQDALEEIVKIETKKIEEANKIRLTNTIMFYVLIAIVVIYLVVLCVFWIYLYSKHTSKYQKTFKGKYYKEFIDDYDVELVEYVMTKNIGINSFIASLLNLIYKNKISIDESEHKKDKYLLTLNSAKGLSASEKKLVSLIFDKIGNGKEVTFKKIEQFSSSSETHDEFLKAYDDWKNSLITMAEKENFFEKNTNYKVASAIYVVLGFIIALVCFAMNVVKLYLIIPLIVATVSFLIYILFFKKWSNRAKIDSSKWKAFKNFLENFETFEKDELPEVKLWGKYMVYAFVLDISEKLEESMKSKLSNLSEKELNLLPTYFFFSNKSFSREITEIVSLDINL